MPAFTTLQGFKDYLQISHTDDDTALTALLDSSEGYIGDPSNGILGRPVAPTAFVEEFDCFDSVQIAFPDEAAITSVTYLDADDTEQALGAVFRLYKGALVLLPGEAWPTAYAPITVSYAAGFATVPEQVKTACYFYAASMFEKRDVEQMKPEVMRQVLAQMLAGYRRVGL